MKRIFTFVVLLLIFLSGVVSCKEKNEIPIWSEYQLSNSFITCFFKMNSADLSQATYDEEKSIYTIYWQGHSSEHYTEDYNAEYFKILCGKYGDYGFNAYLETGNNASINEFSGITITSDSDFPGHPAGTELNDIVYVRLFSANPFIDSGYLGSFLGTSSRGTRPQTVIG